MLLLNSRVARRGRLNIFNLNFCPKTVKNRLIGWRKPKKEKAPNTVFQMETLQWPDINFPARKSHFKSRCRSFNEQKSRSRRARTCTCWLGREIALQVYQSWRFSHQQSEKYKYLRDSVGGDVNLQKGWKESTLTGNVVTVSEKMWRPFVQTSCETFESKYWRQRSVACSLYSMSSSPLSARVYKSKLLIIYHLFLFSQKAWKAFQKHVWNKFSNYLLTRGLHIKQEWTHLTSYFVRKKGQKNGHWTERHWKMRLPKKCRKKMAQPFLW